MTNRTFPSKNTYVKNPTAAADVISMNGYVIRGKVHAHMTMATPDKAFGGHLESGTTVFTFAIVTLGVARRLARPLEARRQNLSLSRSVLIRSIALLE